MADPQAVFQRILITLGAKNAPEAARILGLSKQSVYDWQKGVPSIENLLKVSQSGNTSLHWLLTGQGSRFVDASQSVTIEDVIESKIRKIVREEIGVSPPVQQLGLVDSFDIAAAVEKYDNAAIVLASWYAFDRVEAPELPALEFKGWDEWSLEEKVSEIKAARGIMDRQRERRKRYAPKES